jgi:F0F1-type ATP synthase epsilon subunit
LRLVVRTPHAVVLDEACDALRVPTHTGQVGLRPGTEASVLVIEPGLALVRRGDALRYLATAGGVLRHAEGAAEVFTPLAVVGEDVDAVRTALAQALAAPSDERELRALLGRLEGEILRELRRPRS